MKRSVTNQINSIIKTASQLVGHAIGYDPFQVVGTRSFTTSSDIHDTLIFSEPISNITAISVGEYTRDPEDFPRQNDFIRGNGGFIPKNTKITIAGTFGLFDKAGLSGHDLEFACAAYAYQIVQTRGIPIDYSEGTRTVRTRSTVFSRESVLRTIGVYIPTNINARGEFKL